MGVHLTDVFLDDVEIGSHATFSKHLNGHTGHGSHTGTVFDGLANCTGVRQGIACGSNNHLLLTHEIGNRSGWFLAVMAAFWHDNEQDTVGTNACSVVEGLTDFGRGWVAHDEDVFASTQVHAGVDHSSCTFRHFFAEFNVIFLRHRFLSRVLNRFMFIPESIGFVHDVLDILVERVLVIAPRTFSAKREDHVWGTVQMFLNVCIFSIKHLPKSFLP